MTNNMSEKLPEPVTVVNDCGDIELERDLEPGTKLYGPDCMEALIKERERADRFENELARLANGTECCERGNYLMAAKQKAEAEAAAKRKDSERIDWLQNNLVIIRDIGWIKNLDLRDAIDAAIKDAK